MNEIGSEWLEVYEEVAEAWQAAEVMNASTAIISKLQQLAISLQAGQVDSVEHAVIAFDEWQRECDLGLPVPGR